MRNVQMNSEVQLLLASADSDYADHLASQMRALGHTVEQCHNARGVLRMTGRKSFDILILDVGLSAESDVDLVSFVRRQSPGTHILVVFEVHQMERALDCMRRGAYLYLPKSCPPADVAMMVEKAIRTTQTSVAAELYEKNMFEEMLGSTPGMKRVIELIAKVAPTDSTVLLLGESGTGKEVLATMIHRLSVRRDRPFVAINCAALPEALLESEMFGHVRGAFTGADRDKRGLFEESDSGTIFLDEIGDMSLVTQAKLLRVLQNGEIRPVGSSEARRVDVRVIAATNKDMVEVVQSGAFREDLYYRLNVIQIRIPPLRERKDTLPKLIRSFVQRFSAKFNKNIQGLDEHAQVLLSTYDYPGNVRELESIITHAVIMADDDVIRARDLPDEIRNGRGLRLALPDYSSDYLPTLAEMEGKFIRSAMEKLGGKQTEVAKRLGISRSTLWRKMKEYGIPAGIQ